jgi:hypothetical protein
MVKCLETLFTFRMQSWEYHPCMLKFEREEKKKMGHAGYKLGFPRKICPLWVFGCSGKILSLSHLQCLRAEKLTLRRKN